MDRNQQIMKAVDMTYYLIMVVVINQLNSGIKDFFMSEFIMFTIFTLFFYQKNGNVLLSIATAFATVVFVIVITTEDPVKHIQEKFELIYPTTNTKIGCGKITVKDLISKFGTVEKLKLVMIDTGVPNNLVLDDTNAPEIATYIINNGNMPGITDTCSMKMTF